MNIRLFCLFGLFLILTAVGCAVVPGGTSGSSSSSTSSSPSGVIYPNYILEITYDGPGPDMIWFTADDNALEYQIYFNNNQDNVLYKTGGDHIPFTSDDHVEGYWTNIGGTGGKWCGGPGPDVKWFTVDDQVGNANKWDSKPEKIYSNQGPDGTWMTEDDIQSGYYQDSYDIYGDITNRIRYSGKGPDNTWQTADDILGQDWFGSYWKAEYDGNKEGIYWAWTRYSSYDSNNNLKEFRVHEFGDGSKFYTREYLYTNAGTDGIPFTPDDPLAYYKTAVKYDSCPTNMSALSVIPDNQLSHNGNPDQYSVYVLTGDSLSNKSATVNNLAVDTSTVGSISASVQNIVNSKNTLTVVTEISSPAPDYVIDYTGPAKQVPDTYYGINIQIESHRFFTLPKYKELVRNIKVDIARFPGGQERVRYDRDDPSSDNDVFGLLEQYQYKMTGGDVSNFIALCRELNIQAEPEVNLYNDDVCMQSNFIDQIVNGLGYDLKYISAGNEPENNIYSNWFYFQGTNWGQIFTNYMARYTNYCRAIRAFKPDVSFALIETGSKNPKYIMDDMLKLLGGYNPGAVSGHWYMLEDSGNPNDPVYPSIEHMVIRNNNGCNISFLTNIYFGMKQKRDQYIPGDKLFLGEWNACCTASPASAAIHDSLAHAIFTAEVFEFGKKLGFDSMQYFSLSDPMEWDLWRPALIAVKGDYNTMSVRPQYYVRMLYKYACGDKFIDIPDNQKDDYSIYASKDNNYNYLMLINRTEHKNYQMVTKVITRQGTKYLKLILPKHSVTAIRF